MKLVPDVIPIDVIFCSLVSWVRQTCWYSPTKSKTKPVFACVALARVDLFKGHVQKHTLISHDENTSMFVVRNIRAVP